MRKAWKKYWFVIVVVILCIMKQFIASSLPVFGRDAGGPDQYKLLQDAENLYAGTFLSVGDYDIFALFKRAISFPIFLAVCHWLGISYMSGYTLLYTSASLLALYAITQFVKNRFLLVVSFAIVLFCPFSYDNVVQMIYNLSFTAPLAIGGISCLILVYCKIESKNSVVLFWSILAGINMAAIWLNREDSMWIIPLISIFLIITIAFLIKKRNIIGKKESIKKLVILVFPLVFIVIGNFGLSYTNYVKYGIYTTNDYTATNFEKAYNSLLKIRQDYYPVKCSITRSMLEEAYEVSPSMQELKPYMDEFYEHKSYDQGDTADKNDGEIEDPLMNIALRDAASRCGYYENAVLANDYWGRVCEELERAFEEEKLSTRNIAFFGTTLHHPWRSGANYTARWIKSAYNLLKETVKHTLAVPRVIYNSTDREVTARYEAITLNYTVDKPYYVLRISGWLFPDESVEYELQLVNADGKFLQNVDLIESPDIAEAYKNNKQAEKCRFSTECKIDMDEEVSLKVLRKNKEPLLMSCENGLEYPGEGILYYFDNIEKRYISDADEIFAHTRVKIAEKFASIYFLFGPILFILFIIGYFYKLYNLLKTIRNKEYRFWKEWIFQSAILGSVLVLLIAISFVNEFMWGALFYMHTVGSLLDFCAATAIAIDGSILWERIKSYKAK